MNTVVEAGYLGSISRHLESLRAVNEALPACPSRNARPGCEERSAGGPFDSTSARLFPNFGRIQLVDNGGIGSYNSLGTKLTKRFSHGLTYLVSYTWAKSLDTATAIRNLGGDTLFPQNSYLPQLRKRRVPPTIRGIGFVTSALWDLPFGKGRVGRHQKPGAQRSGRAGGN